MKELILNFLLSKTDTVGIYNGGGEEPTVVYFSESEEWEKNSFLDTISEELAEIIKSKQND